MSNLSNVCLPALARFRSREQAGKNGKFFFQRLEKNGGPRSVVATDATERVPPKKEGSALIVTLWVIIILSLLISSFAFDMHIESGITSFVRKRAKAQYLARAGVAWTETMLNKEVQEVVEGEELVIEEGDDEDMVLASVNLTRGVGVSGIEKELGEGKFVLSVLPEEGRRNVNTLTEEDWEEILDQGNVPEDLWPELIDCFNDWIDEGDEHRLNGAEADDVYYKERGYVPKNAPMDTIDELLLVKGFSEDILYGKAAEEEDEEDMPGIASWLTTWGDGLINVNTASEEVLMTLPGIDEWVVEDILTKRLGPDGEAGTRDDGFDNVDEVVAETGLDPNLKEKISTTSHTYLRVISIGEVQKVRSGIWCVLQTGDGHIVPVFWREEAMP